jgi:hypothetical protein
MTVGLNRASSYAVKREVTAGEYLPPASGADFVPLRPDNTTSYEPESLESDELLNDIGAAKSATGKEATSGTHSAYLKHSGVEGVEPEIGIMYESVMGAKQVASVEYDTVAASTTSVVKVDVGEGANFVQGQALLFKSGAGFEIRNVASITGDDLSLNFSLPVAPASGVNLGKAITYLPVAQGHPTFSTTKYIGGGFAKVAASGNTTTEVSVTADANGFGEVSFSFAGTRYYYNPVTIDATSKFLDITDDSGTFAVSVAERIYETPIDLADAILAALVAASPETYTVVFSNSTGKFTIASSTSAVLSILWNTGANAANSIGAKIGFLVAADDTGSTSYLSDNEQSYAAPYTPSYDVAENIIIKGAELFVGNQSDNLCICAQTVSITISKEVEDVDCICEDTGVLEKVPTSRSAEMAVTSVLKKHDAALLDALLKNNGVSAMLNVGPKSGGNWVAGKCANFYMQKATVSAYNPGGDSFATVEFTLTGYVTSTEKDIYINFV